MDLTKNRTRLQQDAILATAMAFYDKGIKIQYDSVLLTPISQQDGGRYRQHLGKTPEFATVDTTLYTVCSVFCYEVYRQALGLLLAPTTLEAQTKDMADWNNDMVVYRWKKDSGVCHTDALKETLVRLEIGDLLVFRDLQDTRGHVMLYIGEGNVIHSAGRKYNMETGVDAIEKRGSIWISPWDSLLIPGEVYDAENNCSNITILRPLQTKFAEQCGITPAAQTRLCYPRMVIERTCSVKPYRTVLPGQQLTYMVTIENRSSTNYNNLRITEPIPAKTMLVSQPLTCGGYVEADTIHWNVSVEAGTAVTLQYCVTVTGHAGDEIVSTGGSVGRLQTNELRHCVSISEKRNICLQHFSVADMVAERFVHRLVSGFDMVELRKSDSGSLIDWKKGYVGGKRFHAGCAEDYVFEIRTEHFDTGDILIRIGDLNDIAGTTDYALCSENGDFHIIWGEKTTKVPLERFFESVLISDLFFVVCTNWKKENTK